MEEELQLRLSRVKELALRLDMDCLEQWQEMYLSSLKARLLAGNLSDEEIANEVKRWQGVAGFVRFIKNETERATRYFNNI